MIQTPPTVPPHVVVRPHVLGHLQPGDLRPVWPNAAFQDRRGGKAIVDCRVSVDTKLRACRVLAEGPVGHGFGQAALQVVDQLRASPRMVDGVAVEGGVNAADQHDVYMVEIAVIALCRGQSLGERAMSLSVAAQYSESGHCLHRQPRFGDT